MNSWAQSFLAPGLGGPAGKGGDRGGFTAGEDLTRTLRAPTSSRMSSAAWTSSFRRSRKNSRYGRSPPMRARSRRRRECKILSRLRIQGVGCSSGLFAGCYGAVPGPRPPLNLERFCPKWKIFPAFRAPGGPGAGPGREILCRPGAPRRKRGCRSGPPGLDSNASSSSVGLVRVRSRPASQFPADPGRRIFRLTWSKPEEKQHVLSA